MVALFVLAFAALAVVVLPGAMTQPLTYHTPDMIAWLYGVRAWGTTVAFALLLVGAAIAYRLWKDERTSTAAAYLGLIPLGILVAAMPFSRQQLIEWILFAPPGTVAYEAANGAAHVAASDYVMGVAVGEESRAYPILMVAYYHIINEEIDGEPFVVTY